MTNTLSPKGFQAYGLVDGTPPNFGMARGKMAYNASACYSGDVLVVSGGKLAVTTNFGGSGAAVAGVAVSFSWVSTAQNRRVWQNWYPGNDSRGNQDVDVDYINNPQSLFIVQADGGPVTQAQVGQFTGPTTGTGNAASGLSGQSLYSTTTGAIGTLPFYVYKLVQAPATDPASAYNQVIVGFTSNLSPNG
jgi:hypothetical protein